MPWCVAEATHSPLPSNGAASNKHLIFQSGAGTKFCFVKDFRREGADARRKAPGLGQENSAIVWNGLVALQDVLQGGRIGAFRMGSLLRLFKLLGLS